MNSGLEGSDRHVGVVTIDRWMVSDPAVRASVLAADQRRHFLEVVRQDWRPFTVSDLAIRHIPQRDTYLSTRHEGRIVFPGFQFNSAPQLWPELLDVFAVFRDAGWDEYSNDHVVRQPTRIGRRRNPGDPASPHHG